MENKKSTKFLTKKNLILISTILIIFTGFYIFKLIDDKKELINKVSPIAQKIWDDSLVDSNFGNSKNFDVRTKLLSSNSTDSAKSIIKLAKQINKKLKMEEFEFTITSIDDSDEVVLITHGTYKGDDQIGLYTTIPKNIAQIRF